MLALAYGGRFSGPALLEYAISAPVNTPADQALGLAPGQLQRALAGSSPSAMATQLMALSAQSQLSGLPHIWAGAIGETLMGVPPEPALWPKAGELAAHLAYAGYGDRAAQWYDDIRARSSQSGANTGDVAAARAVLQVWPWALVANPKGRAGFSIRVAELWLQTYGMDESGGILPTAKLFFAVLEGLGYDLGAALRVAVDGTLTPLPAALPAMDAAAAKGQVGVTLLEGVKVLGSAGTMEPVPATLRSVLANLRLVGHDDLARALAVEAMLHGGLAR
ncbi:MAG: hypothetical protein AAF337_12870 [Pseudomonadota bacterium]